MEPKNDLLLHNLRNGKKEAFHFLYDNYYNPLCNFSYKYVKDRDVAEDIVQNLIFKIWEKRDTLNIPEEMKGYLFRSVLNNSLDYIRKNNKNNISSEEISDNDDYSYNEDKIETYELHEKVNKLKNNLPKSTINIFNLNRNEGLTYTEISKKLNISVKTVEYHMSKTLKYFKTNLSEYLSVFVFLILLTKLFF